jgi:AcrR family transcriptional regulator
MTAAQEPRRLRADAARNRQALIDAAERLFIARGLSVTLDDIAAEAGVNVATAYRHFANKHELTGAFVQQKIDDALAIAERAAAVADPWQGLTEFLSQTAALMAANRGLHDVFTARDAAESLERLDERFEPLLRRLIGRGHEAGVVREDVEPGDLGVILHMLAIVSDIPANDQGALQQRYLELILPGLRPSASRLPGVAPTPAQARAATLERPPGAGTAGHRRGADAGPAR